MTNAMIRKHWAVLTVFCAVLCAFSVSMNAQLPLPSSWVECDRITEQRLNTVIAIDSQLAIAAGGDGIIVRTTDRGQSWYKVPVAGTYEYSSAIVDPSGTVYMTMSKSTGIQWDGVVVSRDQGLTWVQISDQPVRALYYNSFNGEIWGVPSDGPYVLVSNDGCVDWRRRELPTSNHARVIHFIDGKRMYVGCRSGTLLFSEDGGESWVRQAEGKFTGTYKSIAVVNDRVVVTGGDYSGIALSTPSGKDDFDTVVFNSYPYIHSISYSGKYCWFLQATGVFWKDNISVRSPAADGMVLQGWDDAPGAISWYGASGLGFIVTQTGRIYKTEDHGLADCAVRITTDPTSVNVVPDQDFVLEVAAEPNDVSIRWQVKILESDWTDVRSVAGKVLISGGSLRFRSARSSQHQQQFRAIASNRQCSDTSAIATIEVSDTCTITVYDTVRIGVTDTLFITIAPTTVGPMDSVYAKVYPNPSADNIVVDVQQYEQLNDWTIVIADVVGRIVHQDKLTARVQAVNLKALAGAGQYYLRLLDDQDQLRVVKVLVVQ